MNHSDELRGIGRIFAPDAHTILRARKRDPHSEHHQVAPTAAFFIARESWRGSGKAGKKDEPDPHG